MTRSDADITVDEPVGDGHKLGIGAVPLLAAMRDEGPDAVLHIDSDSIDASQGSTEARDIRALIEAGYITPLHDGSSDYCITAHGTAALESIEAEWSDAGVRIRQSARPLLMESLNRAARSIISASGPSKELSDSVSAVVARMNRPIIEKLSASMERSTQLTRELLEASGLGETLHQLQADLAHSFPKLNLDAVHHGWACLLVDPDEFNVAEFLTETGIPLAGATPPVVAEALMETDPSNSEGLILTHRTSIIAQCRYVLDQDPQAHATAFHLNRTALDLLEGGQFHGAQALASCALDPVANDTLKRTIEAGLIPRPEWLNDTQYGEWVEALIKHQEPDLTRKKWKVPEPVPSVEDRFQATLGNFRWSVTMPVLLSALTPSSKVKADGPYSRHATVHPANHNHFNEANAFRAVMTTTSLLWALAPTPPLAAVG